ncbi:hypothetical protein AQJ66_32445 [Streptomyces bungoensis]|uniref:Uncharacterized protein n=1 Tax=Streptomyces bungoensis TaxID=285568 RepID=A0A117R950_9ACTN|nr:hypothetical protein [Streptomyces bungoensis]KUN77925.1 hypothetical protein AQJ66_32445 [Streptomyces bungoensis]
MDPMAPELLTALASGTAGAAGQQLWASLRALVHRPSPVEPTGTLELDALAAAADTAEGTARAADLTRALAERARQDPAFADALGTWQRTPAFATVRTTGSSDVHNTVSGGRQQTVMDGSGGVPTDLQSRLARSPMLPGE